MTKASEKRRARRSDFVIKSELSQVRTEAELYFMDNDSYIGFTTDLVPPKCSGDNYIIQISPDGQKYLIYARLCKKDALWCLDSEGFSGEIVADSMPSDVYSCPH